jgi:beta-lactamase regulating signal transducer with metallopeptidase domain/ketosteroid isomerase-like protein
MGSFADVWAVSMLDFTLKGSTLLIVVVLISLVWRGASASVRHLLWTLGICGVLLMPALTGLLPAWHVQGLPHLTFHLSWPEPETSVGPDPEPVIDSADTERPGDAALKSITTNEGTTSESTREDSLARRPSSVTTGRSFSPNLALLFAWAIGTLMILGVYVAGAISLRRTTHEARPLEEDATQQLATEIAGELGLRRTVRLRRSEHTLSPHTSGMLHPTILLPREWNGWDAGQRRQVLLHEFAHVLRNDCLTQSLAYFTCALFWFNPLVWLAARQLRIERERACDDQVLLHGAKPSMYADNLLRIASSMKSPQPAAFGGVAMARRTQMSGRLLAVLDPDRPRRQPGRTVMSIATSLFVALALPLAVLQPAEASRPASPSQAERARPTRSLDLDEFRTASANVGRMRVEAFRTRDLELMSACFTEDFRVYVMGGLTAGNVEELRGIEELSRLLGLWDVQTAERELFVVGDMVVEVGEFDALDAGGDKLAGGRYMTLWKKVNGQWRIHRDIANH